MRFSTRVVLAGFLAVTAAQSAGAAEADRGSRSPVALDRIIVRSGSDRFQADGNIDLDRGELDLAVRATIAELEARYGIMVEQ